MPTMRPGLLLFGPKDEGQDQWVERGNCGTSVGRGGWAATNGRKSGANAHCDAAGKAIVHVVEDGVNVALLDGRVTHVAQLKAVGVDCVLLGIFGEVGPEVTFLAE